MMAGSKIFAYLSYMSYCCFRHSSVSGCIKERLANEASWFYFLFTYPFSLSLSSNALIASLSI